MWGMEYYIGIRALNGDGRGVGGSGQKAGKHATGQRHRSMGQVFIGGGGCVSYRRARQWSLGGAYG